MNVYEIKSISDAVSNNPYVGRGITVGTTPDGERAAAAYFIMGRSENSRNRVFKTRGDGTVYTAAYDETKCKDPSLIIYNAVREYGDFLILTNGDQTDTVYNALEAGIGFEAALECRSFEPDEPNFTPRISALLSFAGGSFSYKMNICKSIDARGSACTRHNFSYPAVPGLGHFIHTYVTDGSPIPSFVGEPERIAISNDINIFAGELWSALDTDNKISLYVVYTEIKTGRKETVIINKNM